MSDDFLVRDNRQPRHFWADNEIVDVYGAQLGTHAFAVYMVLCRYAINNSGEVRISTRRISRVIGISPQGALNALNHLERLGLVRMVEDRTKKTPGMYQLADVKALLDPSYAQLRLVGKVVHGVHPVDSQNLGAVHTVDSPVNPVDATVHGMDTLSTRLTGNKEEKTFVRLKTKKTDEPVCKKCHGKGEYELKGHPGEFARCGCNAGAALLKKPRPEVHT